MGNVACGLMEGAASITISFTVDPDTHSNVDSDNQSYFDPQTGHMYVSPDTQIVTFGGKRRNST